MACFAAPRCLCTLTLSSFQPLSRSFPPSSAWALLPSPHPSVASHQLNRASVKSHLKLHLRNADWHQPFRPLLPHPAAAAQDEGNGEVFRLRLLVCAGMSCMDPLTVGQCQPVSCCCRAARAAWWRLPPPPTQWASWMWRISTGSGASTRPGAGALCFSFLAVFCFSSGTGGVLGW